MPKELISLEEHNIKASSAHYEASNGIAKENGIACPKCGTELVDTSPKLTLMTRPPQKDIHCPSGNCDYKGMRIEGRDDD